MQTDVGAEEEISSYLFFAPSIYTVRPCDATSVTASLLTTHVVLSAAAPPLNLVLPFENLSLFFSLRAPPGLLPPPSRNARSNLLAVRNRLISLATGTGGTRDTSWQRQSRLSRISCAEKRAASSSACILSGLLQLCSTVGRIGRVRMWRVMQ